MIGTENKTGHLSNVCSHRKQPFRLLKIELIEGRLSATSGHSMIGDTDKFTLRF
jgi:hypothetical protein